MSPYRAKSKRFVIWGSCIAVALLSGCSGESGSPSSPVPTGGQEYVLDYATFTADISPLLEQRGCNATGDCHGGGIRGSFELSPPTAPDASLDFEQVCLQVRGDDPTLSPLLLKPLDPAAGGSPHAVSAFASTDDSAYVRILQWIDSGEFR